MFISVNSSLPRSRFLDVTQRSLFRSRFLDVTQRSLFRSRFLDVTRRSAFSAWRETTPEVFRGYVTRMYIAGRVAL